MVTWRPQIDKEKYKQAILFLLNGPANNSLLGKVKLFKLLYYIDFDHYQNFKTSVTGDIYRKLPYGPVGDNAASILSEMESNELLRVSTKPVGNYSQYMFTSLESRVNLNVFLPSEITTLNQIVEDWANRTTNEIVAATHGEAPWRAVDIGAEIPYSLAFYRSQAVEKETNNYDDLEEVAIAG